MSEQEGTIRVPADVKVWDPDRGKWQPVCRDCAEALASRGYTDKVDVDALATPWPRCIYLHTAQTNISSEGARMNDKTPFQLGYQDGLDSPTGLSMGRTWDDGDPFHGDPNQDPNEEYDRGVNAGQAEAKRRAESDKEQA